MRFFCTYFDFRYLPRGLALYESLRRQCPEFVLWVLCLDRASRDYLEELGFPNLRPIDHEEFIRNDEPLRAARDNRSLVEYYFTCTPSLPLYILRNQPEVDLITYLDADLFFFSSPEPLFEEMAGRSVAIISHRFAPEYKHLEVYGIYNVGWISFRRDEIGSACLNWWRERCLEWCHDRLEDDRFGDQKYLDQWPALFGSVAVLEHPGGNVAAWNLAGTEIRHDRGNITANGQPLVFYHFHNIHQVNRLVYEMKFLSYGIKPCRTLRRHVLSPYLRLLRRIEKQIPPPKTKTRTERVPRLGHINHKHGKDHSYGMVTRIKVAYRMLKDILSRKYFVFVLGRVLCPLISPMGFLFPF